MFVLCQALLRLVRGPSREVFELLRDLWDHSLFAALLLVQDLQSGEAEEVLSLLESMFEGADFRLKRKAVRVVAAMSKTPKGPQVTRARFAAVLAKPLGDLDATVRCEAALAGESLLSDSAGDHGDHGDDGDDGVQQVQARLSQLLRSDPCWRVRCCAARALARWTGSLESLDMSGSIEESDGDVRLMLGLRSLEPLVPLGTAGTAQHASNERCELSRKLRILAVHGANSNSAIMRFQVRFLKAKLPEAEWAFVDAPLIWQAIAGAEDPIFREPSQLEKTISKGEPFRCWYSHGNSCYNAVDEGVASLLGQVQSQAPVDVLLCFSQGSNCVSLALDNLRRNGTQAPWALTVMFSGGQIDDEIFAWPAGWMSDQPTLRVYSAKQDSFFQGGEMSLKDMYSDLLEIVHEDGHMFPQSEPRAAEIYDQLSREIRARFGLAEIPIEGLQKSCAPRSLGFTLPSFAVTAVLPSQVQLEPIFNRLAEDREHVKISKMSPPQLVAADCPNNPSWCKVAKVLVCSATCSSQAGCEDPEGSSCQRCLKVTLVLCSTCVQKDGFVRLRDIMELKNFRPYNLEAHPLCYER